MDYPMIRIKLIEQEFSPRLPTNVLESPMRHSNGSDSYIPRV